MGIKVANNAYGTLNAGISNVATTLVLSSGEGSRFPTLSAGDYFYATLIDTSNNLEIVKVTARATDTMTVVRGQDGTTARAYSTNDRFELRPTAALFNEKQDLLVSGTNIKTVGGTSLLGSGDVAIPNPTIASTAEAQAGTNNTNFITPLRMREGFNASDSAPVYVCRAWVNFNGTGTVAIRASGNVSSITDNGTGNYTVNFTNAIPDANYATVGQGRRSGAGGVGAIVSGQGGISSETGSYRANCVDSGGISEDFLEVSLAVFR